MFENPEMVGDGAKVATSLTNATIFPSTCKLSKSCVTLPAADTVSFIAPVSVDDCGPMSVHLVPFHTLTWSLVVLNHKSPIELVVIGAVADGMAPLIDLNIVPLNACNVLVVVLNHNCPAKGFAGEVEFEPFSSNRIKLSF